MTNRDLQVFYFGFLAGVCLWIYLSDHRRPSPSFELSAEAKERLDKRSEEWQAEVAEDRAMLVGEIADAVAEKVSG